MQLINVDITGAGPHTIIAPEAGRRFLIHSCLMTFAHQQAESQPIRFYSGSRLLYGPYYVYDGRELEWERDPTQTFDIRPGEPFVITMASGVKCGATIEFEVGTW